MIFHKSLPLLVLPNKICRNLCFFFRKSKLLFSKCNTLHKESHISCKCTHRLPSFLILFGLSRCCSMDAVPVLAGCNRHSGNGKIFVQLIKCRRTSATSCTGNACSPLSSFYQNDCCRTVCQDRRSELHLQTHSTPDLRLQDHLLLQTSELNSFTTSSKHIVLFAAGTTCDTATDRLISDYNRFYFYTILLENIFHLAKCNGCVTICFRASVEHKYFFKFSFMIKSSFLVIIPSCFYYDFIFLFFFFFSARWK